MNEDRFTNSEVDAGLYEQHRAMDEGEEYPDYDDSPEPDWDDSRNADKLLDVRDERCFTGVPF